jgi:hypothetical protein
MKLIAKAAYSYASRRLRAGDEFEASEKDADILLAIGRAERYVEPKVAKCGTMATEKTAPRVKRAYKRRDMRAE